MLLWNKVFPDNITAFTTDASQDFSLEENQSDLLSGQKKFLQSNINSNVQRFINIRQVHEDLVLCIDKENVNNNTLFEADGLITNLSNVALMVRTADCLPIFLHDPTTQSIGVIHAGWKGSKSNIASKAVSQMAKQFGVGVENLHIFLGPCIGKCCYEVGEEFKEDFCEYIEKKDGSFYLDLKEVNRSQLLDSGIKERNILDSKVCTCCDKNCHSFRRDQDRAGRMVSLIMLNSAI